MKKVALSLVIFLLVFGGLAFSAEKVDVPLEAIKSSCYGEIDMSKAEFALSNVGKECVSDDWLEDNLPQDQASGKDRTQAETDQGEEITESKETIESFQIDEFRIYDYDGDPRVEGVFADNTDKGSFVALFPFGEEDGEIYNKTFFLPNETIRKIAEGDPDSDGQVEISSITDKNVYIFDWSVESQDMSIDKTSAPKGKEITDGHIISGRIVVSVDEIMREGQYGFYEYDNGAWKPFENSEFNAKEFVKNEIIEPMKEGKKPNVSPGPVKHFASSDDSSKLVYTVDNEDVGESHDKFFMIQNGSSGIQGPLPAGEPLDVLYENLDPWNEADKEFILPTEDNLWEFNSNYGKFNKYISPYGENLPNPATNFEVLPVEEMTGTKLEDGGMNYIEENWMPKFGDFYPWALSTNGHLSKNGGFWATEDKLFRSKGRDIYGPGFDARKLPEYLEESEVEDINDVVNRG